MEKDEKLAGYVRQITGKGGSPKVFNAEVKSVSGDVCTVDFAGLKLEGVKMAVSEGAASGVTPKPKSGGLVTVLDTDGTRRDMYAIKFSALDALDVQAAGFILHELVSEFVTSVRDMTIPTPTGGVGTVDPATIAILTALELKFNKMFGG